jgi:hypothetical protein
MSLPPRNRMLLRSKSSRLSPVEKFGGRPRAGDEMLRSHERVIADAAKAALGPLDFRRKGRSRIWLADQGWWLTVVEFQPSQWSKGSYLNVAAHWLWSEMGCISFDFGGRMADFVEYRSEAQFASAAASLAQSAAQEARRLSSTFASVSATADILLADDRANLAIGSPGWTTYHAGIVAAIVGRQEDSAAMFARILSAAATSGSALREAAERMASIAADPSSVRREVGSLIERQRAALRLPPLQGLPFLDRV